MIKPDKNKPVSPLVSVDQLIDWFYIGQDGVLYNRVTRVNGKRKVYSDTPAGSQNNGYVQVQILGRRHMAHHIAYAISNGRWPVLMIDHIDGDKSNNNPSNLRETTARLNQQNQSIHRNGRLPGCHFDKKSNKWRVRPLVNLKPTHVGLYNTQEEAHTAYLQFISTLENTNADD